MIAMKLRFDIFFSINCVGYTLPHPQAHSQLTFQRATLKSWNGPGDKARVYLLEGRWFKITHASY